MHALLAMFLPSSNTACIVLHAWTGLVCVNQKVQSNLVIECWSLFAGYPRDLLELYILKIHNLIIVQLKKPMINHKLSYWPYIQIIVIDFPTIFKSARNAFNTAASLLYYRPFNRRAKTHG